MDRRMLEIRAMLRPFKVKQKHNGHIVLTISKVQEDGSYKNILMVKQRENNVKPEYNFLRNSGAKIL